jgi:hypothetical protein
MSFENLLTDAINTAITNAIRNNSVTYSRRNFIIEEEYVLQDTDDLSSTILLDIVTRFGSPGNDSFMKMYKKSQLKSIGKYKKVKCDSESECPICLDQLKLNEYYRELACKHVFHKKCIDRWFKKDHSDCPMCRAKIIQ